MLGGFAFRDVLVDASSGCPVSRRAEQVTPKLASDENVTFLDLPCSGLNSPMGGGGCWFVGCWGRAFPPFSVLSDPLWKKEVYFQVSIGLSSKTKTRHDAKTEVEPFFASSVFVFLPRARSQK